MIQIGQEIPDFELDAYHDDQFTRIKLSDYRGRWIVLVFYPADFTFVCPTELEDAAALYPEFRKLGAEILSVSTDTTYVHKAWHDASPSVCKIQYPMIADPTGRLSRAFGVYLDEAGLALRGTFVVDPDGVLRTMEVHDLGIGRSAREALRKLQAAVFVRQHGDLVCPANWVPGGETLKPGLDLVGKL